MDLVTLALAKSYIDKKINEEGIVTGATPQQAAQIEQNKIDIADLQTEVDELKESGSNGSGENATSLTLTSPNGTKWAVTVSDDGILAAAKLGGPVEPEEPDTGGDATENITQSGSVLTIM